MRSNPRRGPLQVFATLIATLIATHVGADELYTLKIENDSLFSSKDGQYTNGIELSRTFIPEADHWTRRLADELPGWSAQGLDASAYHLAHHIYTPNDIGQASVVGGDRPYAGLLLGSFSLFGDTDYPGWREASVLKMQVGFVGPATGAEPLQEATHKVTGSEDPEGWDNQLDNEPIVNVGGHKAWWLPASGAGLEFEYGPTASFALGNLYSYVGGGAALRFGEGLDKSFGIPSVAPAQGGRQGFLPSQGFGWYGFIGMEGRYMAHNLLLDGNTFEDSHSVDRREWGGDLQLGVVASWGRWQVAYANVWRSREFERQKEVNRFSSVTFSAWL